MRARRGRDHDEVDVVAVEQGLAPRSSSRRRGRPPPRGRGAPGTCRTPRPAPGRRRRAPPGCARGRWPRSRAGPRAPARAAPAPHISRSTCTRSRVASRSTIAAGVVPMVQAAVAVEGRHVSTGWSVSPRRAVRRTRTSSAIRSTVATRPGRCSCSSWWAWSPCVWKAEYSCSPSGPIRRRTSCTGELGPRSSPAASRQDPVRIGLGQARPGEQDADRRVGQGRREAGLQRAIGPDDDDVGRSQCGRARGLAGVLDPRSGQAGPQVRPPPPPSGAESSLTIHAALTTSRQ